MRGSTLRTAVTGSSESEYGIDYIVPGTDSVIDGDTATTSGNTPRSRVEAVQGARNRHYRRWRIVEDVDNRDVMPLTGTSGSDKMKWCRIRGIARLRDDLEFQRQSVIGRQ